MTIDIKDMLERLEERESADVDNYVSDIITTYQAVASQIKVYDDMKARLKVLMTEVILETGQDEWKTDTGSAYIPRPSSTVRYDAKSLDALCRSDSELARKLAPHRVESERAGSLTIR